MENCINPDDASNYSFWIDETNKCYTFHFVTFIRRVKCNINSCYSKQSVYVCRAHRTRPVKLEPLAVRYLKVNRPWREAKHWNTDANLRQLRTRKLRFKELVAVHYALYSKIAKSIQWNLTCCEEIFEYIRMCVISLCKKLSKHDKDVFAVTVHS